MFSYEVKNRRSQVLFSKGVAKAPFYRMSPCTTFASGISIFSTIFSGHLSCRQLLQISNESK